jgi:hypothetical protein
VPPSTNIVGPRDAKLRRLRRAHLEALVVDDDLELPRRGQQVRGAEHDAGRAGRERQHRGAERDHRHAAERAAEADRGERETLEPRHEPEALLRHACTC